MNNIDILEEKEKKAYDNLIMLKYFTMEKEDKESIDIILKLVLTLIAENKELKEKIKEINEEYNAEQKHEMENTIPKSKVEEKIEELEKGDKNTFIRGEKILVLQSLLGKE